MKRATSEQRFRGCCGGSCSSPPHEESAPRMGLLLQLGSQVDQDREQSCGCLAVGRETFYWKPLRSGGLSLTGTEVEQSQVRASARHGIE